jgi:F420-non-reducing hydrogenase large subunit
MPKTYEISPVTRVEGHAGIKLTLGDDGKFKDIQLNVPTTRFFEKFLEGRYMEHICRITPRICGSCSIPHHIAPAKAVEDAWGIKIPEPARKLRELLINAKQYSSHISHFYTLAAPDFLYGPLAQPEKRNMVQVFKDLPEISTMALKMMNYGQSLCADIGGKSVHPIVAIPGGMKKPFTEELRDMYLTGLNEQLEFMKKTMDIALTIMKAYWDFVITIGTVPTWYLGLVKPDGTHDIYDGDIVTVSPEGKNTHVKVQNYLDIVAEKVLDRSYTTHTYIKEVGYPNGIYRASSLAMVNACEHMATPLADAALKQMREMIGSKVIHNVFAYHWARIIESYEAIEKIKILLEDPEIVSTDVKTVDIEPKAGRGVGVVESPQGLLIYDLSSDEKGLCKSANLIVGSNHNFGGIEKTLNSVAKQIFDQNIIGAIGSKLPKISGKTLLG